MPRLRDITLKSKVAGRRQVAKTSLGSIPYIPYTSHYPYINRFIAPLYLTSGSRNSLRPCADNVWGVAR
ncbi:MAG: hypothetical protein ACI89Z_000399 [Porticoccus sp.]|jgi:hypothetical protein